jgi:putative aldouronate transport system permease protein
LLQTAGLRATQNESVWTSTLRYMWRNKLLYLMLIPGITIILVFCYVPLYGVLIAFKDYKFSRGIMGSDWVGFKYFRQFFADPYAFRIIKNTVVLNVLGLLIGTPAPIIFALMLNEMRTPRIKRVVQTISYMPSFLSVVVVVGLANMIFQAVGGGPVNDALMALGIIDAPIQFMGTSRWYRTMYILTGVWSGMGYNSIIYLAAMAGLNIELYESAVLDGANRLQRIWHITLPGIRPTIVILFILAVGGIMSADQAKTLLMYNPSCYDVADNIASYVYRMGILGGAFSLSTAVGLFQNIVGFLMLLITNFVCSKLGETSLL